MLSQGSMQYFYYPVVKKRVKGHKDEVKDFLTSRLRRLGESLIESTPQPVPVERDRYGMITWPCMVCLLMTRAISGTRRAGGKLRSVAEAILRE